LIPYKLSAYIAALDVSRYVIIGIIGAVLIFLGCFIEGLSLMVLTVPILYPLIIDLGFDGIWFGVWLVTLLNIGMVTPPVGINVYVTAGVARGVPLMTIFKGVTPFWISMVAAAILLVVFPEIATWLVSFM
jgi:TRAP-type C4-dicarboxylate transport system permease large subunit